MSVIGIDIETYDPHLKTLGPSVRRDGYILGIGVSYNEEHREYIPIRHLEGDNWDLPAVRRWAKDHLTGGEWKVGANLLYDLDWLAHDNIPVEGPFMDCFVAEWLLDENQGRKSLNFLAKKYLNEEKHDAEMYRWLEEHYGKKYANGGNIWRTPPELCGRYCVQDAQLPIGILRKQIKQINKEGLWDVFMLECRLLPLLIEMRQQGVRISHDQIDRVHDQLVMKEAALQKELDKRAGGHVGVWTGPSIAKAMERMGIEYMRTEKGNPSFPAWWLEQHPSRAVQLVREVRAVNRARSTYCDKYREFAVGDRIHAEFNNIGARSGRFSSSNPNLQQAPARDEELAPLIRSIFIPEDGEEWYSLDYSQIEYRLMAHYAVGAGAEEVRTRYIEDPDTDYHQALAEKIQEATGEEHGRKKVKTVNFGMAYGMGRKKLAHSLGLSDSEAGAFFESYHGSVPFVGETMKYLARCARRDGYVRTLLGRKRRFDLWHADNAQLPLPWDDAVQTYGEDGLHRANLHKALNATMQGSAADIMKKAMVDLYEAGLPIPLLTVHDELCFSREKGDPAVAEVQRIMEDAIEIKVPVTVDVESGPSWGELRERHERA